MFQKICSAVTAGSTFIIAALCVWWTGNVAYCAHQSEKEMKKIEADMGRDMSRLAIDSEEVMEARRRKIDRQLEEARLAAEKIPDMVIPPVKETPSRPRQPSWDPSRGLPPGISPQR
jgi:hypothetical protein